ncbi:MAG: hypothetical protein MHM6MM_001748 [Cercozoa sp. M6MM]
MRDEQELAGIQAPNQEEAQPPFQSVESHEKTYVVTAAGWGRTNIVVGDDHTSTNIMPKPYVELEEYWPSVVLVLLSVILAATGLAVNQWSTVDACVRGTEECKTLHAGLDSTFDGVNSSKVLIGLGAGIYFLAVIVSLLVTCCLLNKSQSVRSFVAIRPLTTSGLCEFNTTALPTPSGSSSRDFSVRARRSNGTDGSGDYIFEDNWETLTFSTQSLPQYDADNLCAEASVQFSMPMEPGLNGYQIETLSKDDVLSGTPCQQLNGPSGGETRCCYLGATNQAATSVAGTADAEMIDLVMTCVPPDEVKMNSMTLLQADTPPPCEEDTDELTIDGNCLVVESGLGPTTQIAIAASVFAFAGGVMFVVGPRLKGHSVPTH